MHAKEFASHVRGQLKDVDFDADDKPIFRIQQAFRAFFGAGHQRVKVLDALVLKATGLDDAGDTERGIQFFRSYVSAAIDDVRDGWETDYMAAARGHVEGDLLGLAEELLTTTNPSPMAAAMVAGAVLENHLRALCAKHGITPKERGISAANDPLKGPAYSKTQWREVQVWGDLRNAADHHDVEEFHADKVPAMVDGVRRFVEAYPA